MPFKLVVRVKAGCPQHRRYNPEKDGLSFKSACRHCQNAHSIYKRTMELVNLIKDCEAVKPVK